LIRVSQSLPQISKMTCTLLSNLMSTVMPNTLISLFVYFTPHETSSLAKHINMCIASIGQYFAMKEWSYAKFKTNMYITN